MVNKITSMKKIVSVSHVILGWVEAKTIKLLKCIFMHCCWFSLLDLPYWSVLMNCTSNWNWPFHLFVGGNQRELARAKAAKKLKDVEKGKKSSEKGANKGMTLEERRHRYSMLLWMMAKC
jgi:hypothetical protein